MSYWQDHNIEKKELLTTQSSSLINPNLNDFFSQERVESDQEQRMGFINYIQQMQHRNLQQGLASDNMDNILNQLFQEAQQ